VKNGKYRTILTADICISITGQKIWGKAIRQLCELLCCTQVTYCTNGTVPLGETATKSFFFSKNRQRVSRNRMCLQDALGQTESEDTRTIHANHQFLVNSIGPGTYEPHFLSVAVQCFCHSFGALQLPFFKVDLWANSRSEDA
jgi:hypothetical protein